MAIFIPAETAPSIAVIHYLPAVSRGQNEVLPLGFLADQ